MENTSNVTGVTQEAREPVGSPRPVKEMPSGFQVQNTENLTPHGNTGFGIKRKITTGNVPIPVVEEVPVAEEVSEVEPVAEPEVVEPDHALIPADAEPVASEPVQVTEEPKEPVAEA